MTIGMSNWNHRGAATPQITAYPGDVQKLGQHLQLVLKDVPISIQCAVRDHHLIILGQHSDTVTLDASRLLYALEHYIQTLHIRFTQQVRLYLRVIGQTHPYAHRWFAIQTSASALQHIPRQPDPSTNRSDAVWVDDDDDLASLLDRLSSFEAIASPPNTSASASPSSSHSPSSVLTLTLNQAPGPFTRIWASCQSWLQSLTQLRQLQPSLEEPIHATPGSAGALVWTEAPKQPSLPWPDQLDAQIALGLGLTLLGAAGGTYGLTRYCLIGSCPELQTAQAMRWDVALSMEQADDWQDIRGIERSLQQGISLLEPIPAWSSYSQDAQALLNDYEAQAEQVQNLLAAEEAIARARDAGDVPLYTLESWERLRSLWQSTVTPLEAIPPDSDLHVFAQQQLEIHREQLEEIDRQIALEQAAIRQLNLAKETARRAQVVRYRASSEDELATAQQTWQTALDQLRQIPQGTIAAIDAQRLLGFYESSLASIGTQVNSGSTAARPAPSQVTADSPVATRLNEVCAADIQFCRLIKASPTIQVQFDADYIRSLDLARTHLDPQARSVAVTHQQLLRNTLKTLADEFNRPLEIYMPDNTLLDRYEPSP